jgi:hypothetical protein
MRINLTSLQRSGMLDSCFVVRSTFSRGELPWGMAKRTHQEGSLGLDWKVPPTSFCRFGQDRCSPHSHSDPDQTRPPPSRPSSTGRDEESGSLHDNKSQTWAKWPPRSSSDIQSRRIPYSGKVRTRLSAAPQRLNSSSDVFYVSVWPLHPPSTPQNGQLSSVFQVYFHRMAMCEILRRHQLHLW